MIWRGFLCCVLVGLTLAKANDVEADAEAHRRPNQVFYDVDPGAGHQQMNENTTGVGHRERDAFLAESYEEVSRLLQFSLPPRLPRDKKGMMMMDKSASLKMMLGKGKGKGKGMDGGSVSQTLILVRRYRHLGMNPLSHCLFAPRFDRAKA